MITIPNYLYIILGIVSTNTLRNLFLMFPGIRLPIALDYKISFTQNFIQPHSYFKVLGYVDYQSHAVHKHSHSLILSFLLGLFFALYVHVPIIKKLCHYYTICQGGTHVHRYHSCVTRFLNGSENSRERTEEEHEACYRR